VNPVSQARVLLVDDDPALLDALSETLFLRLPDVATDTCGGALAALDRIRYTEYDVIISDIKMPGMDGLELLTRLQDLAPDTPTMLITGHGQTDLAIRALRAGAFDLIQKPLDRDYLVAALKRGLETRRLRNEVKANQAALHDYAQNLERHVQQRTEELEKALATKDEFLALVSHELRNPMTVIMGNADVLYRYRQILEESEKEAALLDLRQGTRRLMRLIENLLVLGKVKRGENEIAPTMIGTLIEQQVKWYKQFSTQREIVLSLPSEGPRVPCNPTHIELVLSNLLSNADKYSPPEHAIEIFAGLHRDDFIISVCDRGPGVSPEESTLVFEPFYRSASTSDVQGMGIGLAVSKKLIEANGGRIWHRPRPDGGTQFSFSLPLTSRTQPPPSTPRNEVEAALPV